MEKKKQKQWLDNFVGGILKDLKKAVDEGKVPEEWGGFELSEMCAMKFEEQSHLRGGVILDPQVRKYRSRVKKGVKNEYIVRNI
jgi:hypothetical protein